MSFSPLSTELTNLFDSQTRKKHGIFFTPLSIRKQLLECCPHIQHGMKVLEPSMGSGEFINDILSNKMLTNVNITGVEISKKITDKTIPFFKEATNVNIIQDDFLDINFESDKFDLIIGNPPYFQISKDKEKYRNRWTILSGKFDIYILFILKCLELLNPSGILKLVIPSSFLSTDSYEPIRRLLYTTYRILNIIEFPKDKWLHTCQKTIGIIIQNQYPMKGENEPFSTIIDKDCFLHARDKGIQLKNWIKESNGNTLGKMNFPIKTGEIVWNTMKDRLTKDSSKPLLIHNSYLKGNTLNIPSKGKEGRDLYIECDKSMYITEPVILVNRGNGNNGNLKICFVFVNPTDINTPIVAENHIYKIMDNGKNQLGMLYKSLCDNQTTQFIQTCIGSGFITKRFLSRLPVFL
jgi:hypothetical protein